MLAHSRVVRPAALVTAGVLLSAVGLVGSSAAATPTPELPGYSKPPLQGPRISGPANEAGVTRPGAAVAEPEVAADGEVPGLRTAHSRTFVRDEAARGAQPRGLDKAAGKSPGRYRTAFATERINFRGQGGKWRKIDLRLQQTDNGGARTTAGDVPLELPASLDAPVTVGPEGR